MMAMCALLLTGAPSAEAQTDTETACRRSVSRAVEKYSKITLKTITKCHSKRSKGQIGLSIDCNDIAQADLKNRIESKRDKLRETISGSSADCAGQSAVLAQFVRCPSPGAASDDGGPTDGIDDVFELSECMISLTDALAGRLARRTLGAPETTLGTEGEKCQRTIGKGIAKLSRTFFKERGRCQLALDKSQAGLGYGCTDYDARGKIAKIGAKLAASILARCQIDDSPFLDLRHELDAFLSCGDTPAQLSTCTVDQIGNRIGAGMVAMTYELPAVCTAGGLVRTVLAAAGDELSKTVLSTGWTGTAHNVDLPNRFIELNDIVCDADCANCTLTLDTDKDGLTAPCRCEGDSTATCDKVNVPDPDNCGPINNTCNCNFGPPLSLSSGGVPVCILNRFTADHIGTVDLGTGQWIDAFTLNSKVHLGDNTALQPCPICENDITPLDGVRDGSCSGGVRATLPCDTTAIHPDFGPMSHECPPASVTNVSGSGLVIPLALSDQDSVLNAELPCDSPAGAECHCRVCSTDANIGCSSNDDCTAAGAGECTGGGGAGVSPNGCSDGVCNADGYCDVGPIDTYCDGITRANGNGFIECTTTADCTPLGAGSCTLEQKRACYPDPLIQEASPGVLEADLSATFCIAATTSAAVNQSAGLPGPGVLTLSTEFDPTCASDPSLSWELPSGANCGTPPTTLPPQLCGDSFPICGGECPAGLVCEVDGLACICNTPPTTTTTTLPVPACGDTVFPVCGGTCAPGQSCQGTLIGAPCECLP